METNHRKQESKKERGKIEETKENKAAYQGGYYKKCQDLLKTTMKAS